MSKRKRGINPTAPQLRQGLQPIRAHRVDRDSFIAGRDKAFEVLFVNVFPLIGWFDELHQRMSDIAARVKYNRDLWRDTPQGRIYIVEERDAGELSKYYVQIRMALHKGNVPKDEIPDSTDPTKMIQGIYNLLAGTRGDGGALLREAVIEYKPVTFSEEKWRRYLPNRPGPVKKSQTIDRLVYRYDEWRNLGYSSIKATAEICSYFAEERVWIGEEKEEHDLFEVWNEAGTAEINLRGHSNKRAKNVEN